MMTSVNIAALVLVSLGFAFLAISALGVIIFPDFFTRLHSSGIGETLGAMLVIIGMIMIIGPHLLALKLVIVLALLMLTNPLGTNLIMMEGIHAKDYQEYNEKKHAKSKKKKDSKEGE